MITTPSGLFQMASTCWGTPGKKRPCRSGTTAPVSARVPVSSTRVSPTTTATRATKSVRNHKPVPLVASRGKK
ncbi:MAG: hypothetical protein ACK575_04690 [Cyanobacteriota bacterium]